MKLLLILTLLPIGYGIYSIVSAPSKAQIAECRELEVVGPYQLYKSKNCNEVLKN